VWLSGYAARTHPSTGITSRLSAKALAIEDNKRGRVVIIFTITAAGAVTARLSSVTAGWCSLVRGGVVTGAGGGSLVDDGLF